jgi:hypothetical protein
MTKQEWALRVGRHLFNTRKISILMPSNKFINHSKISKGQYTVTINLRGISNSEKFQDLEKIIEEISNDCDDDIGDIYKYDGNKLTYTSETLFPPKRYANKQKVLIVFGNPAFHSIKNGMFFFSRAENHRHGMWTKLEKANLIMPVRINDDDLMLARKREAEERKKLISSGQASEKYCLGLTTFYSFPTPVQGRFRDVQGAEKLFRPILKKIIIPFEINRILAYSFTQDAILIFVQKSSYEAFKPHCNQRIIFWPVRGKNSSGAYLSKKLKYEQNARNSTS